MYVLCREVRFHQVWVNPLQLVQEISRFVNVLQYLIQCNSPRSTIRFDFVDHWLSAEEKHPTSASTVMWHGGMSSSLESVEGVKLSYFPRVELKKSLFCQNEGSIYHSTKFESIYMGFIPYQFEIPLETLVPRYRERKPWLLVHHSSPLKFSLGPGATALCSKWCFGTLETITTVESGKVSLSVFSLAGSDQVWEICHEEGRDNLAYIYIY